MLSCTRIWVRFSQFSLCQELLSHHCNSTECNQNFPGLSTNISITYSFLCTEIDSRLRTICVSNSCVSKLVSVSFPAVLDQRIQLYLLTFSFSIFCRQVVLYLLLVCLFSLFSFRPPFPL